MDYIGEISLVKDFTSTMDAVLTEEEKAEMQAAERQAEAEATGTKEAASAATAGVSTSGTATPTPAAVDGTTEAEAAGPGTHLAHHSSFSKANGSAASGSVSGDGVAKKDTAAAVDEKKKGKAKLTPEQRAKLDELEAKRDAEKEKR